MRDPQLIPVRPYVDYRGPVERQAGASLAARQMAAALDLAIETWRVELAEQFAEQRKRAT